MTYEDYAKFQALREEIGEEKALKKAQTCNNTINWPLIQGPYDQKIKTPHFHRGDLQTREGDREKSL